MGSKKSNVIVKEKEDDDATTGTAMAVAAAAGLVGLGAWGLSKLFGSDPEAEERKMMKAPGRDYKISRDEFQRDPASYFRDLRKG